MAARKNPLHRAPGLALGIIGAGLLIVGGILEFLILAPNLPGFSPAGLASGISLIILVALGPALVLLGLGFITAKNRDAKLVGIILMGSGGIMGLVIDALGALIVGSAAVFIAIWMLTKDG